MNSEAAGIIFGLASALSWGAGDFSGGVASKRNHVYTVIVLSQVVGVTLLTLLALLWREPLPPARHLLMGGLGGIAGAIGLVALYRGLATGHMGLIAPLTAVVAAGVPVLVTAFLEGLPGPARLLGFLFALGGIWTISGKGGGAHVGLHELQLPLIAGLGFAGFFIAIDQVSAQAVFWPLVTARLSSMGLLSAVATLRRQWEKPAGGQLLLIAVTGLFETGGNIFFALASAAGRVDVASVLASLYPAATVFLAWAILKEQLSRRQSLGVAAVLAAVVLIGA